jgi:hypothetical protein
MTGPTGDAGLTGATGEIGPAGGVGAMGATGETGSAGAEGASSGVTGLIGIGSSQTFSPTGPTGPTVTFSARSPDTTYNPALLYTVPLGTGFSMSDVIFHNTNDAFEIVTAGTYVIRYGFTCKGDTDVMEDFYGGASPIETPHEGTAWIAIEKTTGVTATLIGGVPLVVSQSLVNGADSGATLSEQLISGQGQLFTSLQTGDYIRLKVYISSGDNDAAIVTLASALITGGPGTPSISNGGTLSVIRMM